MTRLRNDGTFESLEHKYDVDEREIPSLSSSSHINVNGVKVIHYKMISALHYNRVLCSAGGIIPTDSIFKVSESLKKKKKCL